MNCCTGDNFVNLKYWYKHTLTAKYYCEYCAIYNNCIENIFDLIEIQDTTTICMCEHKEQHKQNNQIITSVICPKCYIFAGDINIIEECSKNNNKCKKCGKLTTNLFNCVECALNCNICTNCSEYFVSGNEFIKLIQDKINNQISKNNQNYSPMTQILITRLNYNLGCLLQQIENKKKEEIIVIAINKYNTQSK